MPSTVLPKHPDQIKKQGDLAQKIRLNANAGTQKAVTLINEALWEDGVDVNYQLTSDETTIKLEANDFRTEAVDFVYVRAQDLQAENGAKNAVIYVGFVKGEWGKPEQAYVTDGILELAEVGDWIEAYTQD